MNAIETYYKGYRFRSRLEARWAVFFDAFGIDWEYEPEGYDLGDLGWYLPDFYLHDSGWFIEVKGRIEDKKELEKARYLDNYTPMNACGCLILGRLELIKAIHDEEGGHPDFNDAFRHFQMMTPLYTEKTINDYNNAILKGRQARFEHGETPII